jgi:hypothetical protein
MTSISPAALPRDVEGLTPEWLSGALGVPVAGAEVTHVIWGTATKAFLTLTYARGDAGALPANVVVKGGFDERMRAYGFESAYEIEAGFFRDLAPTLDLPLPRVLFADLEPGQGVVVIEDLNDRGAIYGVATSPVTVDEVAGALEVQARWHAQTWGSTPGRFDWLQVGCAAARGALGVLLSDEQFGPLLAREEIGTVPASVSSNARVRAGYEALWRSDDASVLALSHGDAHVGQTYTLPGDPPAFLDWQGACLAPWASDVAYYIGGALEPAVRREHERALLEHYVVALRRAGGPQLDPAEAWRDYQRHTLHGFIWAVTPAMMQSSEIVTVMAERFLAAIQDHDPLTLLGV